MIALRHERTGGAGMDKGDKRSHLQRVDEVHARQSGLALAHSRVRLVE